MEAMNMKATIDGTEYEWGGGYGAVLISHERNVKQNEVRFICGELMYAYMVYKEHFWSLKKRICWSKCTKHDVEWIRAFKIKVFTCTS